MPQDRPFIIGLTGSIGMGKSTVAQMFVDEGVPLFDADAAVHQLQGPDGALVEQIEALFPGTTNSEGVDRQKLGAAVLGDAAALQRLEELIHPAVADLRRAFLEKHRMSEQRFEQIKSLQMPDADKRQKADSLINTALSHAETRRQVQKLVEKLKASLA